MILSLDVAAKVNGLNVLCAYDSQICFRMFSSFKESLAKLVQIPFGVVKAEEEAELVDPFRTLKVSVVKLCSLG